jgi:hypothetical protein
LGGEFVVAECKGVVGPFIGMDMMEPGFKKGGDHGVRTQEESRDALEVEELMPSIFDGLGLRKMTTCEVLDFDVGHGGVGARSEANLAFNVLGGE